MNDQSKVQQFTELVCGFGTLPLSIVINPHCNCLRAIVKQYSDNCISANSRVNYICSFLQFLFVGKANVCQGRFMFCQCFVPFSMLNTHRKCWIKQNRDQQSVKKLIWRVMDSIFDPNRNRSWSSFVTQSRFGGKFGGRWV